MLRAKGHLRQDQTSLIARCAISSAPECAGLRRNMRTIMLTHTATIMTTTMRSTLTPNIRTAPNLPVNVKRNAPDHLA
jgi:hypothetical protein